MPRRRRPPRPGSLADFAPLRILTQIVLLQLSYYATALILLTFTTLAAGEHFTIHFLLDWSTLRGDITEGWMLGLVWMLNSLITVIFLLLFISRSKLVPDFALTIHFLHLLVTSFYTKAIPTHFFWWFLQASSASLMTFLGVWSCQWRELRPIMFSRTFITPAIAPREAVRDSIVVTRTLEQQQQAQQQEQEQELQKEPYHVSKNQFEMKVMNERGIG